MGPGALKPFQLDESCNAAHIRRLCEQEGLCTVRSFPERWKGTKDWQWFPTLLAADAPIVSTDFTIAFEEENIRAMPTPASGILVVRPKHPTKGFGSRQAAPQMAAFKVVFPAWAQTDWSDLYVEITEVDVTVRNLAIASMTSGTTVAFDEEDFVNKVLAAIALWKQQPTR